MALAQALAATHAAAFPAPQVWSEGDFASALGAPGVILIGDAGSFVLGRVILDEAEVLTLATHPDRQGTGLARRHLAGFEGAARAAGAQSVFLEVAESNLPARALYAGAGYAQVGLRRGYYRNLDGSRSDALILRRALGMETPDKSP